MVIFDTALIGNNICDDFLLLPNKINVLSINHAYFRNSTEANELSEYLELGNIIIPFPTLYESINTRFTKRKEWMTEFEKILERPNVTLISDISYKDSALNLTFETTIEQNRPISLVDTIIRIMLDDSNLDIDYLMSFNVGDFFDVCQKRRIEIISE